MKCIHALVQSSFLCGLILALTVQPVFSFTPPPSVVQPMLTNEPFNPYTVETGQVGKTLQQQGTGALPLMPNSTAVSVKTTPKTTEEQRLLAEAQNIKLTFKEVIFSGNHVFSNQQLRQYFVPYLNKTITLAQLIRTVQQVTDKYQQQGYFLSKALLPPQQIANGVVMVQVVEGFISKIEITGIEGKNKKFLEQFGDAILNVKPIKLDKLERYLLLINDMAGFQVKSLIAPDPKVPLGSILTLVTLYSPIQVSLSRDNYQTRYLGPLENTIYGNFNSILTPGGSLYARALASNNSNQLQYYELRHTQAFGTEGFMLGLDGYYTQTHPGFLLAPLNVFGFSGDGSVFAVYPFLRSRERSLIGQGQFSILNNHSTVFNQLLYFDKIRDLTLSLQYNDTLASGQDSVNVAIDRGFNILGASPSPLASRTNGTPDFLKLNGTVSRQQPLFDRFSVFLLASAQWSNRVLLAPEVFTFGGPYLGRGYDLAQFTGDEGVAGTTELRMDTFPNFPFARTVQYYVFYDWGALWNRFSVVPGEVSMASGTSTGVGVRMDVRDHVSLEGFLGRPLTTPNATQVILNKNSRAFLGFFQVRLYV